MGYTLILVAVAIVFFWSGYYIGNVMKQESPEVDKTGE